MGLYTGFYYHDGERTHQGTFVIPLTLKRAEEAGKEYCRQWTVTRGKDFKFIAIFATPDSEGPEYDHANEE